jgi:hypothetical protein
VSTRIEPAWHSTLRYSTPVILVARRPVTVKRSDTRNVIAVRSFTGMAPRRRQNNIVLSPIEWSELFIGSDRFEGCFTE